MRLVVAYTIVCFLSIMRAFCSPLPSGALLTIVFRAEAPIPEQSMREMKTEVGTILKGSGIRIDWRDRSHVTAYETFPHVVMVKFRGKCRMDPIPYLIDERGLLGLTYDTDGKVLPFTEIECDQVRSSVGAAIRGDEFGRSDVLFGRALARVLAHELYHAVTGLHSHGETGIARRSLSGAELISGRLQLSQAELDRMRAAMAPIPAR